METQTPPTYPVYTSGKFWGGTVMPYWVMMIFTAFPLTGFFGLDHLLFRSPSTALSKCVTNIFTLGLWYMYDIVQVFTDKKFVKEYGFSKPMSGPAGLGLDYFRGITDGKESLSPSKTGILSILLFIMYLSTSLLPFGVSNFVAGDTEGGIAKFLLSFGLWGIIWIPFLFVAGFFEVYRNLFDTEKVFTEGALRPTPINFLLESNGYSPNIMNPATIEKEKDKAGFNFYATFVSPFLSFFGITDPKEVLDTTKCQVIPPIQKTVNAATKATGGLMAIAGTVPEIASQATEKLAAFTDPEKLKEAATKAAQARVQMGGGVGPTHPTLTQPMDYLFLGGLGFLILGGFFAAFLRKTLKKKDDHDQGERNDRPSQPQLL